VAAGLVGPRRDADAIGHETASLGKLAEGVDRRQAITRDLFHELLTRAEKHRPWREVETVHPVLREGCKGRVDLLRRAHQRHDGLEWKRRHGRTRTLDLLHES